MAATSQIAPAAVVAVAPAVKEKDDVLRAGKFAYPDGSTYEGQYIVGADAKPRKHGIGTFVSAHMTYSGAFELDQFHGKGTFQGATGGRYAGDFVHNQYNGEGEYWWADGAHYAGGWSLGKMHGQGRYTAKAGTVWSGEFYNGLYYSGKAHVALR